MGGGVVKVRILYGFYWVWLILFFFQGCGTEHEKTPLFFLDIQIIPTAVRCLGMFAI